MVPQKKEIKKSKDLLLTKKAKEQATGNLTNDKPNSEDLRDQNRALIMKYLSFVKHKSQARNICNNIEAQLFSRYYANLTQYQAKFYSLLSGLKYVETNAHCKKALVENLLEFDKILALGNQTNRTSFSDMMKDQNQGLICDNVFGGFDTKSLMLGAAGIKSENIVTDYPEPDVGGDAFTVNEIIDGLKADENIFLQGLVHKLRVENSM